MKLDYKILWIEDDENFKISIKKDIERHILNKGFNPIIETPNKLSSENIKTENFKDYDLMLIDFTLKSLADQSGDIIIEKIRSKSIFTNIVFYSSDTERLKKEIHEKRLSGVYLYDRTDFEKDNIDTFFELVDFFLEKDMDINTLRGIAMAEVAQFDKIIWNIIEKENCKEEVADKIKKQKQDSFNKIKDLSNDDLWLKAKNEGTKIFDSSCRKDVLHSKILKDRYHCNDFCDKSKNCYIDIMNKYTADVLKYRNELAHNIIPQITKEQSLELRKNLINFRNIFKEMEECLCSKP